MPHDRNGGERRTTFDAQLIAAEEMRSRALRLVDMRWWLIPFLFIGAGAAYGLELLPECGGLVCLAIMMLAYNTVLHTTRWKLERKTRPRLTSIRIFLAAEILLDGLSMLLILPVTGGPKSPLLIFVVAYLVFVALFLSPRAMSLVVAALCLGAAFVVTFDIHGMALIPELTARSRALLAPLPPFQAGLIVVVFATTLALAAVSIAGHAAYSRRRTGHLADRDRSRVFKLEKLSQLANICHGIHGLHHGEAFRDFVVALKGLMAVRGVVVSLLDADSVTLRRVAGHDLTGTDLGARPLDVRRSPLLRRVIGGMTVTIGHANRDDLDQLGETFEGEGVPSLVNSLLLVPLRRPDRTIGVLWAFSGRHDRFDPEDVEVFSVAAEILETFLVSRAAHPDAITIAPPSTPTRVAGKGPHDAEGTGVTA